MEMKSKDAKEYVEECRNDDGSLDTDELIELILWSYDKGWSEGIEDYREEYCSTEENEFYRTRK